MKSKKPFDKFRRKEGGKTDTSLINSEAPSNMIPKEDLTCKTSKPDLDKGGAYTIKTDCSVRDISGQVVEYDICYCNAQCSCGGGGTTDDCICDQWQDAGCCAGTCANNQGPGMWQTRNCADSCSYETQCAGGSAAESCGPCLGEWGGCTDESACNYNPDATVDDGTCLSNDCVGECGGSTVVDECGQCGGNYPNDLVCVGEASLYWACENSTPLNWASFLYCYNHTDCTDGGANIGDEYICQPKCNFTGEGSDCWNGTEGSTCEFPCDCDGNVECEDCGEDFKDHCQGPEYCCWKDGYSSLIITDENCLAIEEEELCTNNPGCSWNSGQNNCMQKILKYIGPEGLPVEEFCEINDLAGILLAIGGVATSAQFTDGCTSVGTLQVLTRTMDYYSFGLNQNIETSYFIHCSGTEWDCSDYSDGDGNLDTNFVWDCDCDINNECGICEDCESGIYDCAGVCDGTAFECWDSSCVTSAADCPDEPPDTWICGKDGNMVTSIDDCYLTILIGEQLWMAENLAQLHYSNDNSPIPNVVDYISAGDWNDQSPNDWGESIDPFEVDVVGILDNGIPPPYSEAYIDGGSGRFYNFKAVGGEFGNICPPGWHVPNRTEWQTLITEVGVGSANNLKDESWGDNTTNFSALPWGKIYDPNNDWGWIGEGDIASFWSSTLISEFDVGFSYQLNVSHNYINEQSSGGSSAISFGMSVRCVEGDASPYEQSTDPYWMKTEDYKYLKWTPLEICILDDLCDPYEDDLLISQSDENSYQNIVDNIFERRRNRPTSRDAACPAGPTHLEIGPTGFMQLLSMDKTDVGDMPWGCVRQDYWPEDIGGELESWPFAPHDILCCDAVFDLPEISPEEIYTYGYWDCNVLDSYYYYMCGGCSCPGTPNALGLWALEQSEDEGWSTAAYNYLKPYRWHHLCNSGDLGGIGDPNPDWCSSEQSGAPKHPGNLKSVGPTCPDKMCVGGEHDGKYCFPEGPVHSGGVTATECEVEGIDDVWTGQSPPKCFDMSPEGLNPGGCSWGHKWELGKDEYGGWSGEPWNFAGWNKWDRSCCPGCIDPLEGDTCVGTYDSVDADEYENEFFINSGEGAYSFVEAPADDEGTPGPEWAIANGNWNMWCMGICEHYADNVVFHILNDGYPMDVICGNETSSGACGTWEVNPICFDAGEITCPNGIDCVDRDTPELCADITLEVYIIPPGCTCDNPAWGGTCGTPTGDETSVEECALACGSTANACEPLIEVEVSLTSPEGCHYPADGISMGGCCGWSNMLVEWDYTEVEPTGQPDGVCVYKGSYIYQDCATKCMNQSNLGTNFCVDDCQNDPNINVCLVDSDGDGYCDEYDIAMGSELGPGGNYCSGTDLDNDYANCPTNCFDCTNTCCGVGTDQVECAVIDGCGHCSGGITGDEYNWQDIGCGCDYGIAFPGDEISAANEKVEKWLDADGDLIGEVSIPPAPGEIQDFCTSSPVLFTQKSCNDIDTPFGSLEGEEACSNLKFGIPGDFVNDIQTLACELNVAGGWCESGFQDPFPGCPCNPDYTVEHLVTGWQMCNTECCVPDGYDSGHDDCIDGTYPACSYLDKCGNCGGDCEISTGTVICGSGVNGTYCEYGELDVNGKACSVAGCDGVCCGGPSDPCDIAEVDAEYYLDEDGDGFGFGDVYSLCHNSEALLLLPCATDPGGTLGVSGYCLTTNGLDNDDDCFSNEYDCNDDCIPSMEQNGKTCSSTASGWLPGLNMTIGCAEEVSNCGGQCIGGGTQEGNDCVEGCDGVWALSGSETVLNDCGNCDEVDWECDSGNTLPPVTPDAMSGGCTGEGNCCYNKNTDWCDCFGHVSDVCDPPVCGGPGVQPPNCPIGSTANPAGDSENCTTPPPENYDCYGNCIAVVDCDGVCNGDALEDICGVCREPDDLDMDSTCSDCMDTPNGDAIEDNCGVCVTQQNLEVFNFTQDCAGRCVDDASGDYANACNGVSEPNNCGYDVCGVCDGDDSSCLDCAGVPGGDAIVDSCGVCGGSGVPSNCGTGGGDYCCNCAGATLDCLGVCGGDAPFDACGICAGDGSSCAGCDGVPNSGKIYDECFDYWNELNTPDVSCGGSGIDWEHSECHCDGSMDEGCGCGVAGPVGCDNTCGSTLVYDECGICDGPGPLSECSCEAIPAGNCDCEDNVLDDCNVCGGDSSTCGDCAGVPNGNSVDDDCGVCGGGGIDWENGYCDCDNNVRDCADVCGGTDTFDSCGVCSGDNSGHTADSDQDDCGVCFGNNALQDECGECEGSGINWAGGECDCAGTLMDCEYLSLDDCGGTAVVDDCGICDGGNLAVDDCGVCFGNNTAQDCLGDCDGGAITNACNECVSDGVEGGASLTCQQDCAGVWNGSAVKDDCGVCEGSAVDGAPYCGQSAGDNCCDCLGTPNGTNYEDNCDECVEIGNISCTTDCSGEWGGDAAPDDCGVCDGGCIADGCPPDQSCADCAGVPNGGSVKDADGTCCSSYYDSSCTGGGYTGNCCGACFDCAGVCGGSAVEDDCGECGGDGSSCADQCSVPNGTCFGGGCIYCISDDTPAGCDTCSDECGIPDGDSSTCSDLCGVPNGDNSSCLDDCGVPNGIGPLIECCDGATMVCSEIDCGLVVADECGVCEGDGVATCDCTDSQGGSVTRCENIEACPTDVTDDGICDNYQECSLYTNNCGDCVEIPNEGDWNECNIDNPNNTVDDKCNCDGATCDACGVCGGSGIPEGNCDCTYNQLDECEVCGGDNSSCADECGVPNGDNSSCSDECGVPNGDNSSCSDECGVPDGDNSSCADCNGTPNGDSTPWSGICGPCDDNTSCLDECGVPNGDNSSCADCAGTPNGDAEPDDCGVCILQGEDNIALWNISCNDCAGVPNGDSTIDKCDVCDNNEFNNCEQDCGGQWGGDASEDVCGICGDFGPGECHENCKDCNGTCGGAATTDCLEACCGGTTEVVCKVIDDCGECGGNNDDKDYCGICDGSCLNSVPTSCNEMDCTGTCGGSTVEDDCGVCGGSGINWQIGECNCDHHIPDCTGECGGLAELDDCGVCEGENACEGCNGEPWSGQIVDECGVCNGDGILVGKCDCDGNEFDCANACGGNAVIDCFGVCNGGVVLDECNVCGGNCNTPVEGSQCGDNIDCQGDCSTNVDCMGVCDGTGEFDYCGICNGSCLNSEPTSCNDMDCAGDCFGNAIIDVCGVCGGSGINWTGGECDCSQNTPDCLGECDGTAVQDLCGVCDGSATESGEAYCGQNAGDNCCDCLGTPNGTAAKDECGVCNGPGIDYQNGKCDCEGNIFDCANVCEGVATIDCAGLCGGTAVEDDCDVCAGGCIADGCPPDQSCADCAGIPHGESVKDCNGTCYSGSPPNVFDCTGICVPSGAAATLDECDVCGGNNSLCADCDGVPNGEKYKDNCEICVANEDEECPQDCAGVWGGNLTNDACGVCGGDESSCTDCWGVLNGDATEDSCGECSGGDSDHEADSDQDCSGECFGYVVYDDCGVCGGNGFSCADCAGEPCDDGSGSCTSGYVCVGVTCNVLDNCGNCDDNPSNDCVQDECGIYGGAGIPDGDCDCDGSVEDVCGFCGGQGLDGECVPAEGFESGPSFSNCPGLSFTDCLDPPTENTICTWTGVCDCDGNVYLGCECDSIAPSGCDLNCGSELIDDCNGDCGGDALVNDCAVCWGGDTDNTALDGYDCNYECFESGVPKACCDGIPWGDSICDINSGISNDDDDWNCGTDIPAGDCDCAGNVELGCGCGEAGPSGCNNVCNSEQTDDYCGVCDGGCIEPGCVGFEGDDLYECPWNEGYSCDCFCGDDITMDECGVCGGDGIVDGACDCDGHVYDCTDEDCNGTAFENECGVCVPDGDTSCVQDCSGAWGGDAVDLGCGCGNPVADGCNNCCNDDDHSCDVLGVDECGVCGGNGIADGFCDCAYAVDDECNICGGSGYAEGSCDCDGNVELGCGCGEAGPSGCDNTCGSTLELDDCGVCDGDGSVCSDCADVPNGTSIVDCTNTDGGCYDPAADPPPNIHDCFGVCGGSSELDECGVCGGDNSTCSDCAGVPNGDSYEDNCDTCDSDSSNDCVQDCAGEWGGDIKLDECGVCGGWCNLSTTGCEFADTIFCDCNFHVVDCAGNCNCTLSGEAISNDVSCVKLDACGVCGGPAAGSVVYEVLSFDYEDCGETGECVADFCVGGANDEVGCNSPSDCPDNPPCEGPIYCDCFENKKDCNDECGGTAELDECGACCCERVHCDNPEIPCDKVACSVAGNDYFESAYCGDTMHCPGLAFAVCPTWDCAENCSEPTSSHENYLDECDKCVGPHTTCTAGQNSVPHGSDNVSEDCNGVAGPCCPNYEDKGCGCYPGGEGGHPDPYYYDTDGDQKPDPNDGYSNYAVKYGCTNLVGDSTINTLNPFTPTPSCGTPGDINGDGAGWCNNENWDYDMEGEGEGDFWDCWDNHFDCANVCGGNKVLDVCGVCDGLNTEGNCEGTNWRPDQCTVMDCAGNCTCDGAGGDCAVIVEYYYPDSDGDGLGDINSSPTEYCSSDAPDDWVTNNDDEDDDCYNQQYDCVGDCIPFPNNCDVCDGDVDDTCLDPYEGCAVLDECNVCVGGLTQNSSPCTQDCAGVFGGNSYLDECNVCNDNSDDDCVQDCNGDWGGTAGFDECGNCDTEPGDGVDCNGDCIPGWDSGTSGGICGTEIDVDGDTIPDTPGCAQVDTCGVCSGGNTGHIWNSDKLGCGCFIPAADGCGNCPDAENPVIDYGCDCGELAPEFFCKDSDGDGYPDHPYDPNNVWQSNLPKLVCAVDVATEQAAGWVWCHSFKDNYGSGGPDINSGNCYCGDIPSGNACGGPDIDGCMDITVESGCVMDICTGNYDGNTPDWVSTGGWDWNSDTVVYFGSCSSNIKDCMDVCAGSSVVDDCGECETPGEECIQDCAGVAGGTAELDVCGVCMSEGETTLNDDGCCGDTTNSTVNLDCSGWCNSGTCEGGSRASLECTTYDNDLITGCPGICGGTKLIYLCGENLNTTPGYGDAYGYDCQHTNPQGNAYCGIDGNSELCCSFSVYDVCHVYNEDDYGLNGTCCVGNPDCDGECGGARSQFTCGIGEASAYPCTKGWPGNSGHGDIAEACYTNEGVDCCAEFVTDVCEVSPPLSTDGTSSSNLNCCTKHWEELWDGLADCDGVCGGDGMPDNCGVCCCNENTIQCQDLDAEIPCGENVEDNDYMICPNSDGIANCLSIIKKCVNINDLDELATNYVSSCTPYDDFGKVCGCGEESGTGVYCPTCDDCGVCGGECTGGDAVEGGTNCPSEQEGLIDCGGYCNGEGSIDDCGNCTASWPDYTPPAELWGCYLETGNCEEISDIGDGNACDCDGNVNDVCGVCGGTGTGEHQINVPEGDGCPNGWEQAGQRCNCDDDTLECDSCGICGGTGEKCVGCNTAGACNFGKSIAGTGVDNCYKVLPPADDYWTNTCDACDDCCIIPDPLEYLCTVEAILGVCDVDGQCPDASECETDADCVNSYVILEGGCCFEDEDCDGDYETLRASGYLGCNEANTEALTCATLPQSLANFCTAGTVLDVPEGNIFVTTADIYCIDGATISPTDLVTPLACAQDGGNFWRPWQNSSGLLSYGCLVSQACNYNPSADIDDGTCVYPGDGGYTCTDYHGEDNGELLICGTPNSCTAGTCSGGVCTDDCYYQQQGTATCSNGFCDGGSRDGEVCTTEDEDFETGCPSTCPCSGNPACALSPSGGTWPVPYGHCLYVNCDEYCGTDGCSQDNTYCNPILESNDASCQIYGNPWETEGGWPGFGANPLYECFPGGEITNCRGGGCGVYDDCGDCRNITVVGAVDGDFSNATIVLDPLWNFNCTDRCGLVWPDGHVDSCSGVPAAGETTISGCGEDNWNRYCCSDHGTAQVECNPAITGEEITDASCDCACDIIVDPSGNQHDGYNDATRCLTCKADFYSSSCLTCPECNHGDCDDGFWGGGYCFCHNGWKTQSVADGWCALCDDGWCSMDGTTCGWDMVGDGFPCTTHGTPNGGMNGGPPDETMCLPCICDLGWTGNICDSCAQGGDGDDTGTSEDWYEQGFWYNYFTANCVSCDNCINENTVTGYCDGAGFTVEEIQACDAAGGNLDNCGDGECKCRDYWQGGFCGVCNYEKYCDFDGSTCNALIDECGVCNGDNYFKEYDLSSYCWCSVGLQDDIPSGAHDGQNNPTNCGETGACIADFCVGGTNNEIGCSGPSDCPDNPPCACAAYECCQTELVNGVCETGTSGIYGEFIPEGLPGRITGRECAQNLDIDNNPKGQPYYCHLPSRDDGYVPCGCGDITPEGTNWESQPTYDLCGTCGGIYTWNPWDYPGVSNLGCYAAYDQEIGWETFVYDYGDGPVPSCFGIPWLSQYRKFYANPFIGYSGDALVGDELYIPNCGLNCGTMGGTDVCKDCPPIAGIDAPCPSEAPFCNVPGQHAYSTISGNECCPHINEAWFPGQGIPRQDCKRQCHSHSMPYASNPDWGWIGDSICHDGIADINLGFGENYGTLWEQVDLDWPMGIVADFNCNWYYYDLYDCSDLNDFQFEPFEYGECCGPENTVALSLGYEYSVSRCHSCITESADAIINDTDNIAAALCEPGEIWNDDGHEPTCCIILHNHFSTEIGIQFTTIWDDGIQTCPNEWLTAEYGGTFDPEADPNTDNPELGGCPVHNDPCPSGFTPDCNHSGNCCNLFHLGGNQLCELQQSQPLDPDCNYCCYPSCDTETAGLLTATDKGTLYDTTIQSMLVDNPDYTREILSSFNRIDRVRIPFKSHEENEKMLSRISRPPLIGYLNLSCEEKKNMLNDNGIYGTPPGC